MKITRSIKKAETNRKWFLIDAKGVRLGKLATKCASLLIGKQKVDRVNYLNNGDNVIVINAAKVDVFTKKLTQKKYYRHSGYVGSLKSTPLREMMEKKPNMVIQKAVKGMLPQTKMGDLIMKNLFIYTGDAHKHEAQQPVKIEVK